MWLLEVQAAQWLWVPPSAMRVATAVAVILLYVFFCFALKRMWERKHRSPVAALTPINGSSQPPTLVAFASQTGFAEELAWQTSEALRAAGVSTIVESLAAISRDRLATVSRALFVVSTTGEGDAPDSAARFTRLVMNDEAPLPALNYGVLALGDREYRNYCGFGRQLTSWLQERGARPLFDAIEVDDGDELALKHWREKVSAVTGEATLKWQAPEYDVWRLKDRTLANPASAGQHTFYLTLAPVEPTTLPRWQPGDIAEIRPHHPLERVIRFLELAKLDGREVVQVAGRSTTLAEVLARSVLPQEASSSSPQEIAEALVALPKREFSIASIPADGGVELLIRQSRDAQGRLGLASGWLTEHAWIDARIEMRIRANNNFRPPPREKPLILIGNGTGIAGLRAHLKARASEGSGANWLIFGERNAAHDFYYREEMQQWQSHGVLAHADWAFSRDQQRKVYVQDKLFIEGERLKAWVKEGAYIYVCGSLEGMAPGVDQSLREVLGSEQVQRLIEDGRYKRDVY